MRQVMIALGLAASVAATSAPLASAQPYGNDEYYRHHHHYHHYAREGCARANHRSGAIGAVAGAVGGGIIGSAIGHGNAGATLLGAGAGALTGNAIGRNSRHC